MNLIRLLAIAAVIWFAVSLVKRYLGKPKVARRPGLQTQKMVKCDHCGVHVPEGRALRQGERHYCCKEHAQG